jgi:hypothetical protein
MLNEHTNGSAVAEAAPDTQATSAPNKPNRHERRARVKKTVEAASEVGGAPAEPALHSLEWFDLAILSNEQEAAQRLAEYHQFIGAVSMLKQQRELVAKG